MDEVRLIRNGAVAVLELNRPASGNALSAALVERFTAQLVSLHPPACRAVVVTGAGKHFCAGADLQELATLAGASEDENIASASGAAAMFAALLRCPLVTVAAVHGAAYGGGAGLAAACDIVVADPAARFQFSELRLGFVPALISVFLTRRVAPARLAEMFLDPRPLEGAQARDAGLADELADDPLTHARMRATAIARKVSPSAVAQTKRLLLELALPHLDAQLAHAARVNAAQRAHLECRDGVAQFLARRDFASWLEEE